MLDDFIPVGVLGDHHDPEAAVRGPVQEINRAPQLLKLYFTSLFRKSLLQLSHLKKYCLSESI